MKQTQKYKGQFKECMKKIDMYRLTEEKA